MTDLGKLSFCLGLSVVQKDDVIQIHQRQYMSEMLKKYCMDDAKPVATPADTPDNEHSIPADKEFFQRLLGSELGPT